MASTFKFGFGGDDIDEDVGPDEIESGTPGSQELSQKHEKLSAKIISLDELLDRLPSQISYNTLKVRLRTEPESYISLPRREVFDSMAQLMAETTDVEHSGNKVLADELKNSDVIHGLYEGGGKTWESSVDLAAVLAADYSFLFSEDVDEVRVIELGSGPAIPALALLRAVFQTPKPATTPRRKTHFVLSDGHDINLGLVTVPNILLTWYIGRNPDAPHMSDLEIDRQLLDDFRADLAAYGLSFTFISGDWCPEWADFAFPPPKEETLQPVVGRGYTLVFSSETIYSARSVPAFVDTVVTLLDRAAERRHEPPTSLSSAANEFRNPKAVISAKKLYFGLDGGVDLFMAVLNDTAGERVRVTQKTDIHDEGVGRGVWEVELVGRKT